MAPPVDVIDFGDFPPPADDCKGNDLEMESVLDASFPFTPSTLFGLFYDDDAPYGAPHYHAFRGEGPSFSYTRWTPAADGEYETRSIVYRMMLSGPIGPPSTRVHKSKNPSHPVSSSPIPWVCADLLA